MAEAIGLDVVAEGVETRAQLDFIKEHGGCAVIQGWIFSPAVPAHGMEADSGARYNDASLRTVDR